MSKRIFLLFFVLLSCEERYEYHIQPELQYYIESFYKEAALRNVVIEKDNMILTIEKGLRDSYKDAGTEALAYSFTSHKGQVIIRIDYDYFMTSDTFCIERTIFHEIGHAYFCRGHELGFNVMNVWQPELRCFGNSKSLRDSMINEMFRHSVCYR